MMEAARTSETSVYSETIQQYIPEGSRLYTRRRENLKPRTSKELLTKLKKRSVFWDILPCSQNDVDRRLRGGGGRPNQGATMIVGARTTE
jgi:hypothetical protein